MQNADEVMRQFAKDLEEYGNTNGIDVSGILDNIPEQLRNAWTDELKEYKSTYDEFIRAEIIRSDALRPLYQQSIQAVEEYNRALSSGEGVEEAKAGLDSVQQSVQNMTGQLEGSQDVFDGIYEGINRNAEAAYNLSQAFENNESVKEYAEKLKGLSDIDLKAINFEDSVQSPGEEAFGALINILGLSEDEVQKLIDKLVELGYVQGEVQNSAPIEVSFAIGDYKDTISDVQSSISTLRTALDSLNSGDLSKIDVIGLMQQFPDLVPYIDLTAEGFGNLSAGLSDLIAQQPTSLIKSLEELKESLSTEEERAQVNLLIDSLQRLSSYSDTGMEAYAAATGSTWDDTANVIESVTAQFENLAKVQESVADGLTMSTTKAAELAKMYPEILTNAQFSADGQVTLNEAVVKSILDGNSSIINAQIAKLEADKAELTAKKSFAEAQLNMAKQIGEGEGKISEEVARYRLDAANSLVKALIDAGMDEDRAYAAVAENMAGNTDEFNRIVGEVAQDIAVNMDDAAVSMADSIDINSINAQTSFEYLKEQAWETADAVKAAGKGERAGSAKNVRGGGSTAKGGITVYSHSGTFNTGFTDYKPETIGLDEFQSQLELDIKGYTDAISNIDSQIEVLKELQNTFKNNDGIGGHDYSNKIKQLEKEKEDINNALKDTSKESSKKETAETFNWIEKAISRVQRTVKNFGSTVSATWKNWKDRNDALISQLGEVRKEISLQQSAYQSYMNAAESVGLSDHYKNLVRNGAMSIEDITDDALKEQIKSYQEWYEKALDCADAVQELKNQLAELAKTKFNALEKQFDNAMGITTSGISSLEKQISIVEESGKIAGEAFYGAMSEYATANLEALEKKHAALSSSLQEALDSGSIEKYSDDWFEMTEAISGVEEAILDTRLSLIKYEESMKQVAKLKFDAVAEKFDKITDHISGDISILEKQISLIEESGGIAGETFYNALISQSEQNLAVLQQKYNEMEAELQNGMDSGSISMYDDNWYEMTATLSSLKGEIIDAQTATVQFRNRLKEVSMLRFDSLEGQFDNAIGLITHGISSIEKEIAAVEEAGMIAGESYYRELTKAQEQNIQALEAKYAQLSSTLNEAVASGNVEEYSEEWYKMVNVLNSVEDAIFDARQEVLKYGESIKEIAKLKFDSLESQFSNAIGLISSDMSLIEKQMSLVEESGQKAGESFYRALMESGNEKISALKKEYEELSKAMEGTEKYSEAWYGMANTLRQIQGEIIDTETAVTRYGNSLKEVSMIRIDSIGSQFDNVLSLVSSGIDEIEAKIAIAEASGYTAGDSFYHALVAAETKNLAILEQEYNTLVSALNDAVASGSIQKYDDKWYSSISKISAIRKAYLNAQLSIARSQKTMRDNAAESAESVRDTAKEMFDSLVKQFNGAIGIITSAIGQVEKKIALVEEAGYVAGESFYNTLVEAEAAHIASLIKEYDTLSASLDTVEKYSDSWYDMVGNINSVKDALIDAETALVKYGNALRELEWDMFDRAQDAVGGLSGESDFIRELMESNREAFDRDGTMNDRGLAIQGLHTVNYDIYMRQAQEYGEAIKKINKEIAEDPGNTKLLDRYDELVKLQREAVLNAEDEKTAIKELASEGYDMLIGRVNELADARKDALKAASDLHDYEKTVSEQAADVDRLQKIILSWQGDDSEGMKSVIQKAKSDLVKAQEELSETEYDRYMADQEAMLDTFSDELNEWVDIRLDDVNGLLGEAVSATNSNGQAIRDQINADLSSVGMSVTENFDRIFGIDYSGGVRDIVSEFCAGDGGFASAVTTVNDAINNVVAKTDSVKVSMDVADSLLGDANGRIGSVGDAVNMATDAINHVHAKVDSMDSNVSSRIDSVNAGLGELDESLWDLDEAVDHVDVDIAELDKDTVEGLGDAEDAVKSVGVRIAEASADTVSRIGDTNASLAHVNNRVEQLHNDNGALADCIIAGRFDDTQVVNKVSDVSTQVALVRQVLESISSTVSSISSGSGSQSSSSGGSGSGSSYNVSSLGSYVTAQKTDSYNKSRLNTETSVVDRLKYNNRDSSISERKNLFESWGGSGTYTGSAKQNEWLINQMKKRGYKNGAKEIKEDQIAITQEDGTELILSPYHGGMMTQLHKGDSVLTKKQTQTLFKLSELPQSRLREMFSTHIPDDAIANMMPGIKNVENNPVTTNNDIDVSFTMPNVTTVDDMARFLQSRRAEQIITSIVESRAMGKNRMNKYKY